MDGIRVPITFQNPWCPSSLHLFLPRPPVFFLSEGLTPVVSEEHRAQPPNGFRAFSEVKITPWWMVTVVLKRFRDDDRQ